MIRYPLFKDWWIFIFVFCQIVCCLLFGNPAVGGGIIFDNAEAIATLLLFVVCGCLLLVFVSFLCCCFSSSDFLLLFVFSFLCCCLLSFSLLFWNLAAGGIVVNNAEAAVFLLSVCLFLCLFVCLFVFCFQFPCCCFMSVFSALSIVVVVKFNDWWDCRQQCRGRSNSVVLLRQPRHEGSWGTLHFLSSPIHYKI